MSAVQPVPSLPPRSCPPAGTLDLLGDRSSSRLVRDVMNGVRRFDRDAPEDEPRSRLVDRESGCEVRRRLVAAETSDQVEARRLTPVVHTGALGGRRS